MAKGLQCAKEQLAEQSSQVAKRVFLLTDGQTTDDARCRALAGQFAETNTPRDRHRYRYRVQRNIASTDRRDKSG